MLRRNFLRLAVVGTVGAAAIARGGIARAGKVDELRAVAVAHAVIGVDAGALRLDVTEGELLDAEVSRVDVDVDDYLADFGLRRDDVGIRQRHVTVRSTRLPDALATIIEARDCRVVIWDGVVYRLEAA